MQKTDIVLSSVRNFLNIGDSPVFDSEIVPHIMMSMGALSQNGVVKVQVLSDTMTWGDIIDPIVADDEEAFSMIPLYIMLNTKILFDPPMPSVLDYYQIRLDETIWRLKLIYDMKKKEVL